jgi:hypothetical protein
MAQLFESVIEFGKRVLRLEKNQNEEDGEPFGDLENQDWRRNQNKNHQIKQQK